MTTAGRTPRGHRRRGLTLAEMLVASFTMALVIGAVGSIYVATLKLWNKGTAEDIAKSKASWVLTRATDDFRNTMQVVEFADYWVLARQPATEWDADRGTRMNVVEVDSEGELFLVRGGYVAYFRGTAEATADPDGAHIWRRTFDENGAIVETRQLTDGVTQNPDDPATGSPKPFIRYWPVFETGRALEMTVTVQHKVGPNTAQVSLTDWFMLRNR